MVGLKDQEWGERVCAAVIPLPTCNLSLGDLRNWAKERLEKSKVPTRLILLEELPRNLMGKVSKPELKELFRSSFT